MKGVQLLIESKLPEDIRDYNRKYDKKGLAQLMLQIAERHPDKYAELSKFIGDVGRKAAYTQGETVRWSDLQPVVDKGAIFADMDARLEAIDMMGLPDEERTKERLKVMADTSNRLKQETMDNALARGNSLAISVVSGARGNPDQLKTMLTSPALYMDQKGEPIPFFIRNSFTEGVRPAEYLAGMFGARQAITTMKRATAVGGDFCLAEGTPVKMTDSTVKPIESITVGDRINGVVRASGNTVPATVTAFFDQGYRDTYLYRLSHPDPAGEVSAFRCTEHHKFLSCQTETGVDEFEVLPIQQIVDEKRFVIRNGVPIGVEKVFNSFMRVRCYDIEVDHEDHLFELANGVVCSNSKQLQASASHLTVTMDDCGTTNGIMVDSDGPEIRGRVLMQNTGDVPAGTFLDRELSRQVRAGKGGQALVRSPITCQAPEGICAKCAGATPEGRLPAIGDSVGITAGQALGEPICLDRDTLVRMADGSVKKICDIKAGEYVMGSDMEGNLTPTCVLEVHHNGIRDCCETSVRKGKGGKSEQAKLISTYEHKALVGKGRLSSAAKPTIAPVEKTTKRQWFYMPSDGEVNGNVRNEWALLLGLLTADGAYTGNASSGGVNFTPYDDTILDSIKNILDARKLQAVPLTTPGEYRISAVDQHRNIRKNDDGKWVRNELIELLKVEGMYGQNSYEKTLPASITDWDKYSIAEYIKGLVSCDGWVCKNGHVMGFSSSSARITYWVKHTLEWVFGIYTTRITEKNKKKSDGTFYRTMHEICICGKEMMAKFRDKIGLVGVKSILLDTKTQGVTAPDTVKFCMVAQVPVGKRDTWDLTVDNETHLFALANGLIVSNTQMSLRAKHGGGAYTGKMDFSGMDFLTQFVQSPKVYPHRAEVSQHAGEVTKIEEAPQGGTYIWVGEERHYAPHGYPPIVEVGDKVEPGDQLSDGLVDVKDIIATRGLGEGRLYFSKRLKQMMDDSGAETTQRNTEMLARAVIDHVEIDDPEGLGGFLPGDMASYNSVMQHYSPPPTVRLRSLSDTNEVVGKYLHGNVGHFTAGTRLTPRMISDMKAAGYDSAPLDDEPPAFRPEMERLRTATTANTNDWIANMAASYMKSNLLEGAMRGEEGRYKDSPHFAGPLAFGKGFGEKVRETGRF